MSKIKNYFVLYQYLFFHLPCLFVASVSKWFIFSDNKPLNTQVVSLNPHTCSKCFFFNYPIIIDIQIASFLTIGLWILLGTLASRTGQHSISTDGIKTRKNHFYFKICSKGDNQLTRIPFFSLLSFSLNIY